jgi:hypothetical protein
VTSRAISTLWQRTGVKRYQLGPLINCPFGQALTQN